MTGFSSTRAISGTDTPTTADDGGTLIASAATTVTLNNTGWTVGLSALTFAVNGSGAVTFAASGVTLRNVAGDFVAGTQYGACVAVYTATDEWTIYGSEPPQLVDGSVTLAKMADLAQDRIIGRVTASTGVPEALTPAQVREVAQVAGPVFDVTAAAYGAVAGTGVSSGQATANVTAIQAAIDAAEAAGGGIVWFPGIFNIDSHVVVNSPGVVLSGVSMYFDQGLRQITGTADIVRWDGADFGGIENFSLRYANQATGGTALRLDGYVSNNRFRNLYIWQAYNGIATQASGAGTDPTGEFSNVWDNIRIACSIGGSMRSFIRLEQTNASGTGSVWNNIYCNGGDTSQTGAGAMASHGVYLRQHAGMWKQLNIEWGNYNSAGNFPLFVHGNGGVHIESVYFEGNTLVTGGTLVTTFGTSPATSLRIGTMQALSTKAASGTVSLIEPGAGNTVRVDKIVLPAGGIITPVATFNVFGGDVDTSATHVELRELLDPASQVDAVLGAGYTAGTASLSGPGLAPATYTETNVTTDRAFDADTVAIAELADVVGTLIADLRTAGIVL